MRNRSFKRHASGLLSAVLALSGVSGSYTANAANIYFTADFDTSTDGWTARGNEQVTLSTDSYYSGGGSLVVKGRTADWNGAAVRLPEASFIPGGTYSFSAAVLQTSGNDTSIKMTLQYSTGGTQDYSEIALITAKSGTWTDISNPTYTIPYGAENAMLYIEAPDSLTDIYIDSFTAAEQGTPSAIVTGKGIVNGAGSETGGAVPGDFNGDEVIDIFDMVAARTALIKQYGGSTAADLSVADIDGDGSFAMNDIVLLNQFLLKQIRSFPEPVTTSTAATVTTTTVSQQEQTTTTTAGSSDGQTFSEKIAGDMQISAPAGLTSKRAGVDYGTVETKTYYSKDGGINKNVNILLPAGYNTNEKYPVVYVLHGIFGNETSMLGMGVQEIVGNLIADGEAEKMIVVFPAMFTGSGAPGFTAESSRKYDLIREDIENSLMPFIEQNYSVKTGRDNTAITGFSMGGREALYTGITRSSVYGYVGAACPAPGIFKTVDDYMEHEGVMTESQFKPSADPYMLLISAAVYDGTVGDYPKTYHEALANNGVPHLWQQIPDGGHDIKTVAPHLYNFFRYVFKAN